AAGGNDAVAAYLGNPSAHNLDAPLYGRVLLKALGTRNVFSASTVDQMPKQVSAGLMFGTMLGVPVPDVDRTDHLLILGANPLAGLERIQPLAADFEPEAVAEACGIPAGEIRRLARELAGAPRAAVYGRIGTCTQEFGTLASWLVDVLNVLTGNLDRPGGAMFPRAAAAQSNSLGTPGRGRGVTFGRWSSRVRGLPEVYGELPVSCLAEEIDTPGDGQVRALITIAGTPTVSRPNAGRLPRAVENLDSMLSID